MNSRRYCIINIAPTEDIDAATFSSYFFLRYRFFLGAEKRFSGMSMTPLSNGLDNEAQLLIYCQLEASYMIVCLFYFLGKRRYTLDQIEREEFTEETESERPESEPEVSLSQR
jgi:hypothetical protein